MKHLTITIPLRQYDRIEALSEDDAALFKEAIAALPHAYAPYSKFSVGAAVLLANGKTVTGSNQENSAFPAGICAETTALSAASSIYPDTPVLKLALTARRIGQAERTPVTPCGICRQRVLEYENRFNRDITILMQGEGQSICVVDSVKHLLPLHFSKSNL